MTDTIPSIPIQPAEPTLLARFREFFPEFTESAYPDQRVLLYLDIGKALVSADKWGDTYAYGVSLVAAHHLSLAGKVGADGKVDANFDAQIASKSVGSVSVSYSVPVGAQNNTSVFASTGYGREYLSLVKVFGSGVINL